MTDFAECSLLRWLWSSASLKSRLMNSHNRMDEAYEGLTVQCIDPSPGSSPDHHSSRMLFMLSDKSCLYLQVFFRQSISCEKR